MPALRRLAGLVALTLAQLKPDPAAADPFRMRITQNPYQRAAAGCLLIGVIATAVASSTVGFPFIAAGAIFSFIAYSRRNDYPR